MNNWLNSSWGRMVWVCMASVSREVKSQPPKDVSVARAPRVRAGCLPEGRRIWSTQASLGVETEGREGRGTGKGVFSYSLLISPPPTQSEVWYILRAWAELHAAPVV